jgi:hypothetical protein
MIKRMLDPNRPVGLLMYIITFVYYVISVLPHEQVGIVIAGIFKGQSRSYYNNTTMIIALILVAIYGLVIFRSLKNHPERKVKALIYLGITLVLATVAMNLLAILNVEAIHFLQYAILGVLLFLCFKRFDTVMWISLIAATIDEGFQFFYLAPERTGYLDFNDIIIDQIGCGFGLISLYCMGAISKKNANSQHRVMYIIYGLIAVISAIFLLTGFMKVFPDGEAMAPIQLFLIDIDDFWHTVPPKVTFHVVKPLEGLVILLLINIFYSSLGRGHYD